MDCHLRREKNSGNYAKCGAVQEYMDKDHINYPTDSAKNFSKRRVNGNRRIKMSKQSSINI
jgi:hypothetical protein